MESEISDNQADQQQVNPDIMEEIAFQQQIIQLKQHQYVQQQILEEHYQKNRLLMRLQHDSQVQAFQVQQTDRREEAQEVHKEKNRIESLKLKDETCQSAVASPEVKRRLQEVILQRKRKDAAASMGNLKIGIPAVSGGSTPLQTAILRKVQSESNLLKIKNRRGDRSSGPYSRTFNHQLRLVPECAGGSEDSTPSPISCSSLTNPNLLLQCKPVQSSSPDSSSPSSPQGVGVGGRPLPLSSSVASRSLPNIPSSLERSRRSPPIRGLPQRPNQRHFGRSHSSAILPLRKHLIEKSLAEKRSMDDNQYYYQQNKIERERTSRNSFNKPLEEVMEEDGGVSTPADLTNGIPRESSMDELQASPERVVPVYIKKPYFKGFMGPSGISPLVLSEAYEHETLSGSRGSLNSLTESRIGFHDQRIGLPDPKTGLADLKTGLAFNIAMLKHQCICESTQLHPENPERLQYILTRLVDTGILANCEQVSEMGTLEQIQSCHTEAHTLLFGTGTNVLNRDGLKQEGEDNGGLSKFTVLPCGGLGVDSDTYWNQLYTATAARFAVGSTVELALKIARGEVKNGFAVVRPPGHHAEAEEAMGFCYFNTIAIAAKQLLEHTSTRKILIIDWAIHHGNGVQKIFYNDPRVLYISIHRHDNGNFYPGTGSSLECGTGQGLGHNVNIAWSGGLEPPMADAEYLAAFRSVVMPIARCFEPDFVLVSAGFDAAVGHEHPIGGYQVSTACFAFLTHHLMSLAGGRLQLVLEGGYHTTVLADGVEQCTRALMGDDIEKISFVELGRRPNKNAVDALQKTQAIQSQYWPILARYGSSVLLSHLETWEKEREEVEALSAMAYLSMQHMH